MGCTEMLQQYLSRSRRYPGSVSAIILLTEDYSPSYSGSVVHISEGSQRTMIISRSHFINCFGIKFRVIVIHSSRLLSPRSTNSSINLVNRVFAATKLVAGQKEVCQRIVMNGNITADNVTHIPVNCCFSLLIFSWYFCSLFHLFLCYVTFDNIPQNISMNNLFRPSLEEPVVKADKTEPLTCNGAAGSAAVTPFHHVIKLYLMTPGKNELYIGPNSCKGCK